MKLSKPLLCGAWYFCFWAYLYTGSERCLEAQKPTQESGVPAWNAASISKMSQDFGKPGRARYAKSVTVNVYHFIEVNNMSLDKSIQSGKEHRKQYTGAKAVDAKCRNHGSCKRCLSNRTHKNDKRRNVLEQQLNEV